MKVETKRVKPGQYSFQVDEKEVAAIQNVGSYWTAHYEGKHVTCHSLKLAKIWLMELVEEDYGIELDKPDKHSRRKVKPTFQQFEMLPKETEAQLRAWGTWARQKWNEPFGHYTIRYALNKHEGYLGTAYPGKWWFRMGPRRKEWFSNLISLTKERLQHNEAKMVLVFLHELCHIIQFKGENGYHKKGQRVHDARFASYWTALGLPYKNRCTSIYSSRINLRLDTPGQFTLNEEERDGQVS